MDIAKLRAKVKKFETRTDKWETKWVDAANNQDKDASIFHVKYLRNQTKLRAAKEQLRVARNNKNAGKINYF